MAIIRIGFFFDDKLLVKKNVDRCQQLVESGGDWDRRNRLKAYSGLHLLTIRAHKEAAPLLLDSLSTFTSTELCSYSSLVVYASLAGAVSLPRRDFKTKVVDAPEIRAVFGADSDADRLSALSGQPSAGGSQDQDMADSDTSSNKPQKPSSATPQPTAVNLTTLASGSASADQQARAEPHLDFRPLATLISSLYHGDYASFFRSLASVEQNFLATDRHLYEHKHFFVREMRLRAYAQLLQSYKVVSLESMARSFGVSVDWLDRDLAPFIASQRLGCTIDRVKGVIETVRSDDKNHQYHDVIRTGDQLITKLQKYGQVVRLRGSERRQSRACLGERNQFLPSLVESGPRKGGILNYVYYRNQNYRFSLLPMSTFAYRAAVSPLEDFTIFPTPFGRQGKRFRSMDCQAMKLRTNRVHSPPKLGNFNLAREDNKDPVIHASYQRWWQHGLADLVGSKSRS
ncbi:PCI-domain-containing protein [Hortaea werneckii]|nr:PCI-domain-containing protein [Hortaea werneckii]